MQVDQPKRMVVTDHPGAPLQDVATDAGVAYTPFEREKSPAPWTMQIQADYKADYQLERSEVAVLLASGIFNRAPNLVQILTYICGKYFEGLQEEIKEYNIAVEALGRPADFDQKRDSIVRVEAHRLRKRLREYYENEGASHVFQIEIPAGQYAPKFILKEATQVQPPAAQTQVLMESAAPQVQILTPSIAPVPVRDWKRARALIVLIAGAFVIALLLTFFPLRRTQVANGKEAFAPAMGDEIRILAGVGSTADNSGKYVDVVSHTWSSDRFFTGGSVFQTASGHPIAGTRDAQLYQSRREGAFSYDIPLARGVYELHLYFAETLYGDNNIAGGGETSRIFQVSANGSPLLREFDVIEEVGPSAADVKVFKDITPSSDGKLHLKFEPGTNPAFLNGIEIVPGVQGKMRPVRMVSRERGFNDASGRFWESDRYVHGGQLVARNETLSGTTEPELYRGERFGNLTYTIPVVQPGRYGLKLYFVENWFGPGRPGGGGEGSRIFDILCNGVALKRNFDIFKEAGGHNRALVLSVHDLEPNPQGKLVVSLIPRRNYASLNALEIQDESNP